MSRPSPLYRGAMVLARTFAPRESALASWGVAHRDRSRPLLLFHAASAGELRQAEPVIRRFRARHPDWQLAVSYFSRSGRHVAASLPVDVTGLAPWDTSEDVTALLDAVSPAAIVLAKHDLWPVLASVAAARGLPMILVAASVRPRSGRLRWPARGVLAPAYASLSGIAAVSTEDAERLKALGCRPDRMQVLGDPRYDGAAERIATRTPLSPHPTTLVAGSTWPEDEAILLPAFREAREERPDVRLMIVPHRPSASGLRRVAAQARALGLPAPVSHRGAIDSDPLVVVDEVGPLAFLYEAGVIAYVGGGFGRGGLHSVLEPAALGRPIIVGPNSTESLDARRLEEVDALARLPARRAAAVLQAWWMEWLADPEWRRDAGDEAKAVVDAGCGAADRCVQLVEALLPTK